MTVEYLFKNSTAIHYNAFMDSITDVEGYTDKDKIDFLNTRLSSFRGKLITVEAWRNSIGVLGIEFETEEDLLYFKLKFN